MKNGPIARMAALFLGVAIALSVPVAAKAQTLRWSASGDAVSYDPNAVNDAFSFNMQALVYDGLVRRDGDLKIAPALATSWEVVEPTRWRFKLRSGVTFHDGAPFSADDVVASVLRTIDPGARNKGNLSNVVGAEKVDDLTVDIVLRGAHPLLINELVGISMMSKAWLEANGAMKPGNTSTGVVTYASTHANGTGPFKLVSYEPDSKTVFSLNENWWNKREHNIDGIEFRPIKSDATRVSALLSGELDMIAFLPLQDIARVAATDGFKVVENPALRTIFFAFNWRPELKGDPGKNNPLVDLRVRQALWHAIDLDAIRNRIMRGKSRNTGTLVAPPVPGYSEELDKPLAYDPELAKKLLAEAGYPEGSKIAFGCPNDRYVADEQICLAIAAMWSKIGIQVSLTTESKSTYFPRQDGGEFDISMVGNATLPSIDGFGLVSTGLATRSGAFGGINPGGMSVPAIDDIVKNVSTELDETKRRAMLSDALRIAHDEVLLIPLHQQPLAWAMKSNVDMPQLADEWVRPWLATIK